MPGCVAELPATDTVPVPARFEHPPAIVEYAVDTLSVEAAEDAGPRAGRVVVVPRREAGGTRGRGVLTEDGGVVAGRLVIDAADHVAIPAVRLPLAEDQVDAEPVWVPGDSS